MDAAPLGWIVSIVVAIVGGAVGVIFSSMVLDVIRDIAHVEGSLAKSHHPLFYIACAGEAIFTVLGSWLALQLVERGRAIFHGRRESQRPG